jgi:hypothetical protein
LSLLQWTVCGEDGKTLFTAEDLAGLMNKSSPSAFLCLQDAVTCNKHDLSKLKWVYLRIDSWVLQIIFSYHFFLEL